MLGRGRAKCNKVQFSAGKRGGPARSFPCTQVPRHPACSPPLAYFASRKCAQAKTPANGGNWRSLEAYGAQLQATNEAPSSHASLPPMSAGALTFAICPTQTHNLLRCWQSNCPAGSREEGKVPGTCGLSSACLRSTADLTCLRTR